MAGSNGTYYKASASIDGNRVVVWNNGIPNPEYIRYAYESNPFNVNFYNEEGLPAAPFKIRVNHPGLQIHSFKSTDYAIDKGESALLTWQVYGADEALLNQMVLDTVGGIRVWPSFDSTFTLRIQNRDQPELIDSQSIRIYVKQPDPTISLSMDAGLRVSVDSSRQRMNSKIRAAQLMKVPYMLILGDQEVAGENLSLRRRDGYREGGLPIEAFIAGIKERIKTRSGSL